MLNIVILIIALIVMIIGLIGEVLPGVPGMILIWAAALTYGIIDQFQSIGLTTIILLIAIWLIASAVDHLATFLTAKKLGVSWWGIIGALLAGLFGLIFFNIIGFIIGSFLGAIIGEYWQKRQIFSAVKAGGGMLLGFVIATALKIGMAISMLAIFVLAIIF